MFLMLNTPSVSQVFSSFFFFVLLQSDNEFKGTKFATFMAELKKGSFK